jgi:heterotetrameric sarcosine oxidase gamma subunit
MPSRRSALAPLYREGRFGAPGDAPGVTLAERHPLSMLQIAAWPGGADALVRRLGLLPGPGRSAQAGETGFLWLGPDRWLAVAPDAGHEQRLRRFDNACADLGTVVDLSHARTCIRVGGPRARDLLAKGTGIDLHPRAFESGACASSLLGHVAAILHAADREAVDVYIARSYALFAWEWLTDGAAEFGFVVPARGG